MMRYLSKDQKNLYQQYSRLSEEAIKVSKLHQENKSSNENIWKLISKEGIWRLPIPRQYGGHGLSWQDCVVALDGFFSNYSDIKCFTLFMSQVSSLYLVSQYGTESVKTRYLPRLIQGEMACLVISECIQKLLHQKSYLDKNRNQILYMNSNKILIHAEKNEDDIVFYISEKKSCTSSVVINKSILIEDNKFIAKDVGLSALCDLINFERLFYGILAAKSALMTIEKCQNHRKSA